MRRLAPLLLILLAPALASCGLRPLYAGGSSAPAASALSQVEVGPIAGQSGWLVRTALLDRLGKRTGSAARYTLQIELDDQILGSGVRTDNVVTRERRTLRARYRLIDANAGGAVLLDATASSDAGLDVVTSEYAVIAAEQTALERISADLADQIVARLALAVAHAREAAPAR